MSTYSGIKVISNIWDDEYVEKLPKEWKCKWCNNVFSGHIPNRVISHLARIRVHDGRGIRFCQGNITPEKLASYQYLAERKNKRKNDKIVQDAECKLLMANHTNNIATQYLNHKSGTDEIISIVSVSNNKEPLSDLTPASFASSKTTSSNSTSSKLPKNHIQTVLDFQNNNNMYVLENGHLDVAIADFVHSKGLSFRITEDVILKDNPFE
jgi:hypothetical protein